MPRFEAAAEGRDAKAVANMVTVLRLPVLIKPISPLPTALSQPRKSASWLI